MSATLLKMGAISLMKDRFQQVRTRKKMFFFKEELERKIMKNLLDLEQKHMHT